MSFVTACSFIFNGINSHNYNLIIGWMNSSEPDVSINGLNREIKKTTNTSRAKNNIYGIEHADAITFNFGIFKRNGEEITRPESIKINQWLTSSSTPKLLKFNDYDTYQLHYYAVCTQIKDIIVGGRLIGKELTFETNSSYAFSKKEEKIFKINENITLAGITYFSTETIHLNNPTDNMYYPIITIHTAVNSVICIENVTDQKSVKIVIPDISLDSEMSTIKLNSEKLTILDENNNLIPASHLGWDENYSSVVPSTGKIMDNVYWLRLLKGINEIKVISTTYGTFKIEYEYPRKAGCL